MSAVFAKLIPFYLKIFLLNNSNFYVIFNQTGTKGINANDFLCWKVKDGMAKRWKFLASTQFWWKADEKPFRRDIFDIMALVQKFIA